MHSQVKDSGKKKEKERESERERERERVRKKKRQRKKKETCKTGGERGQMLKGPPLIPRTYFLLVL